MSQNAYALVGLTAIVAALVGLLTFVVLRTMAAMRDLRGQLREGLGERVFMATALEEAVGRVKAQERAMAARAAASERFSADILSSLTAGLVVVGLADDVKTLNAAAHRMLGLAPGVPVERLDQLEAAAPALVALVRQSLATGVGIARQVVPLPGGRAVTHLGVTVSLLSTPDRGTDGAIGLFTDLSAVVALEEQVRLKDGLARLGELTAGLAHEFRNGLATVHGYARLMEPSRLPAEYAPFLEGIRGEACALDEVVTRFLAFARPAPLTLAPVPLGALTARVADDFRAAAERAGGCIRVDGEFPTVEGDEVLLRQGLANLLQNALNACASAGTRPAILIEGRVDPVAARARITVRDNGPGIPVALRDRVFQPFFTAGGNGTGLGLALVQKIVVSHGGRVAVAGGAAAAQGADAGATDDAGGAAEGVAAGAAFHVDLPLPPSLV